ncbi:MAG: endonuclease/exonuclease/phosphatase family protein [Firmicutes bacterium]|nr:endonuclease/exonuclease/phosphatase family protein [Bacillota bacterium]
MRFTIMSFNLRYWNQHDGENSWPQRRDSVAAIMRAQTPWVIGTQEGLLAMLTDLDERLPEYDWVGMPRCDGDEGEHCAVFFRKSILELVSTRQIWLSETPSVPGSKSWDASLPRICTWAVLRHRDTGEEFAFFNTHLDHAGKVARKEGAALILREMQPYLESDMPCLLTGDFNCLPHHEPIKIFQGRLVNALEHVGKGMMGTFHGFTGKPGAGPIDDIFCSPNVKVIAGHVLDYQVDGRYPSDHFPITAEIET